MNTWTSDSIMYLYENTKMNIRTKYPNLIEKTLKRIWMILIFYELYLIIVVYT